MRHKSGRHVPLTAGILLVIIVAAVVSATVVVAVDGIVIVAIAGNSGRLMEMLHGSEGWGKLVSELQQKEEDDAQQAAVQADQQQQPQPNGRKRGRPLKDSSDPLAQPDRFDCLLLMLTILQGNLPVAEAAVCFQRGSIWFHFKLYVLLTRQSQQICRKGLSQAVSAVV